MLTERVATIRENFLAGCFRRGATKLLTQDGKYLQSLPASAMAAKNKDGQNRRGFQGLPVTTLVPVKLVQVKKLLVSSVQQLENAAALARQADAALGAARATLAALREALQLTAFQGQAAIALYKESLQANPENARAKTLLASLERGSE